jgi:hypothetical protein
VTDAGYVIGGWTLTGVAIAGYVGRLWARSRRARRFLPPDDVLASGDAADPPKGRSEWR